MRRRYRWVNEITYGWKKEYVGGCEVWMVDGGAGKWRSDEVTEEGAGGDIT